MTASLARIVVLTSLVALLLVRGAGAAVGHPGASIWGELVIEDDVVHLKIEGAADPFRTCFQLPHLPIGPLEPDQIAANRTAIESFTRDALKLKIDGTTIVPTVVEINVQDGKEEEMSWRSTFIKLDYAWGKEPPKAVALQWPRFEGEGVTYVSFVIRRGAKGSPRMYVVTPDEPEFIWHSDDTRPRLAAQIRKVGKQPHTIPVPIPSVAALLLALAALTRAGRSPKIAWPAFLALLATAYGTRAVGRVEMPWPFSRSIALPAEAQAKDLFTALNTNVYRAFEAESESAIYDLLADSVAPELLDDLYGQIYESLVMREQNGAICSVEDVENVGGKVDLQAFPESDPPAFEVDWNWRVIGSVSHWGHVHRRMNEYRADFVVKYLEDGWKIAKIEVKEQQRVDDDG